MGLWDDDSKGIWGGRGSGIWSGRGRDHHGGIWDKSRSLDGAGVFNEAARATYGGDHARGIWDPVNPWRKKVKSGW
jgi:hypothetical protein